MKKKIMLIIVCVLLLTGCTKSMQTDDGKIVKYEKTGQTITENIICKPTDKDIISLYEQNGKKIENLPKCENFSPIGNYEGLWTSIFVKPLAWVIIQIGTLANNYGLALIIACLIIRALLYPVTKKTAMQSELLKEASPELEKLEKKYQNKNSKEDQTKKAQEMMLIYQKYRINPISGCLLAFIQLPLLFAFYEAILRTPVIFESKFLGLELGRTPLNAITNGQYGYIILILLILVTTYISFSKTLKDQSSMAKQMKFTIYFMLVFILFASFTLTTALGIYWVTSSLFTIFQNYIVERKKVNKNG